MVEAMASRHAGGGLSRWTGRWKCWAGATRRAAASVAPCTRTCSRPVTRPWPCPATRPGPGRWTSAGFMPPRCSRATSFRWIARPITAAGRRRHLSHNCHPGRRQCHDIVTRAHVPPTRHCRAPSAEATPPIRFLDRDHSILAFNERVLDWAHRADVPLLERLRYLCIVSSNLDEFFEVRAEPHLAAVQAGEQKGEYTVASFEALAQATHKLFDRQYALYNDELMPAFAREGIEIVSHGERNAAQKAWVHEYFEREVRPLLIPVGLDPAHPFPQVANKSLNFIVRLSGKDAFGRENEIAIVKVPRVLPRLIRMPGKVSGKKTLFVSLSSVIRAHLEHLFPGRAGGAVLAVPRDAAFRPGRRRGRRARPAHRAAPGAAAPALRAGRSAGSLVRLLRPPGEFPAAAVPPARAGAVPRPRAREPGAAHAAHRPGPRAAAAVPAVPAVVSGATGAGALVLRAAQARRRADPPAVREFRWRAGLPARGGGRPEGARHQADHLPHGGGVGADGPAARSGAARQGSHGGGGTEGALRRGGQHQLGRKPGGHRGPGRVRRRGPEDARQDAAGDAPRRQAAGAVRAPFHRQLQPPHGAPVHRHQPPHGRPRPHGRHGERVRAPGQPEPAAAPEPRVARAVPHAPQADRTHRSGRRGRRPGPRGAASCSR